MEGSNTLSSVYTAGILQEEEEEEEPEKTGKYARKQGKMNQNLLPYFFMKTRFIWTSVFLFAHGKTVSFLINHHNE